jgi:DNA-binding MarR family transcriptional regulator
MSHAQLPAHAHLAAFSALLARDEIAGQLHMRDLQVIALLIAHDTPMTIGTVAALLGVSSPHVSRVAEKLVNRGLLERTHGKEDRRNAMLAPTEEGRALDQRVRAHFADALPKQVTEAA